MRLWIPPHGAFRIYHRGKLNPAEEDEWPKRRAADRMWRSLAEGGRARNFAEAPEQVGVAIKDAATQTATGLRQKGF